PAPLSGRCAALRLASCGCGRPPRLPSFPTRRSSDLVVDADPQQFRIDPEPAVVHRPREQRPGMPDRAGLEIVTEREVARHLEERDRKSTRLNSSHVSTSYAVFCLKKKQWQPRPHPGA